MQVLYQLSYGPIDALGFSPSPVQHTWRRSSELAPDGHQPTLDLHLVGGQ